MREKLFNKWLSLNYPKDVLNASPNLNIHYIGVNGVKIQMILDVETVWRKKQTKKIIIIKITLFF